jgi:uncharacterized protein YodC (DUF2158 family)
MYDEKIFFMPGDLVTLK